MTLISDSKPKSLRRLSEGSPRALRGVADGQGKAPLGTPILLRKCTLELPERIQFFLLAFKATDLSRSGTHQPHIPLWELKRDKHVTPPYTGVQGKPFPGAPRAGAAGGISHETNTHLRNNRRHHR